MEDIEFQEIEGLRFINNDGEIMPWFTLPCLHWLVAQDWSDKKILEFGAGDSTLWFSKRCKHITTIETSEKYFNMVDGNKNITAILFPIEKDIYLSVFNNTFDYDIVIVDGEFRDECMELAIKHLQKSGGLIIADNWQQRDVWVSPYAEELMKDYEREIFIEPGREQTWKTAVFKINKQ